MAKRQKRSGTLTPAQVLARIRKGDFSPLYAFYGPEDLEKKEVLKTLIDAVVEPATRTFNLDVLHAENLEAADAVNRAAAFPMMAARRMVVIKRVDRLPESAATQLLPLIRTPSETTVLVLTAQTFDARKKLFAGLRKSAVCVEFKQPYESEIPDWIRRRVEAAGKRIEPEAVHLLHMGVGAHPQDLANELEKLAIHLSDRKTITRDDVARVAGAFRGATVFELADAVGRGQSGPALASLKRLLEQGEHPVSIVAMLIRHIGILRKARWLEGLRLPRTELAGRLKVPPFFLSGYMNQAARFDDQALWDTYGALLDADDRLKSHSRTPFVTLSRLIYDLCRRPGARP